MRVGTVELDPARIPADQRAALAWILRNALETADQRAAAWHGSNHAYARALSELARIEALRGEVLTLIAALEGDGRPRAELVAAAAEGQSS